MSVNEILAYLELHYWILIVVILGVSILIILRLFYKNLNKENLENLIRKNSNRTSFDLKSENEESSPSSKKPFEDQFYDNSESPEVEMEMESIKNLNNLNKDNLFIKTEEKQ